MKDNIAKTKTDKIVHLFVSLPTEDVCSLRDVDTSMLVRDFKSKVELKVGIPGDLIHLFFMNDKLEEEKPLSGYKLKHGCVLRVRLHKTWLGLFMACWKGDSYEVFNNGVQRIDIGVQGLDVDLWNQLVVKRATFALFMVTHRGYLSLILELLNTSAADVNGCTVFGRTSLHVAAYQGFVGCVSLLLSEGALSNPVDGFGKTALQLASINRHIYCQKRLYLHQTSGGNELNSARKSVENPEEMYESFSQTPSTKMLGHRKSLPKIDHKSPASPQNSTSQSKSYILPEVRIIQDPEERNTDDALHEVKIIHDPEDHQPKDDSSDVKLVQDLENYPPDDGPSLRHTYPNVIPNSETSTPPFRDGPNRQRTFPRNIHGIEKILRTSEEDLIGEYHNINESLANENITTLVLTLPRDSASEPEIPGKVTKEGVFNGDPPENIVETPPRTPLQNRRILGFVLKADETKQEIAHEQFEDKVEAPPPDPDQQVWDQSMSIGNHHRKLISSLSYDEWLKKKKDRERLGTSERPSSATTGRGKSGREIDGEAFQKWLSNKKKFRQRRASSPSLSNIKTSSGASFEMWLAQKRKQNFSSQKECVPENFPPRPKTVNSGGKTFAEWLSEKQKKWENDRRENSDNRERSCFGKSFKEWLKDKRKEKQKEIVDRELLEIEKLQEKAFLEEQRRQNPRVKTFQEWMEGKRAQKFIESVRSQNAPGHSSLLNSDAKFQEDADLVFEMWLTSKHMEELSKEEEMYEEMKEKWRKKEQERIQLQSLRKLNQFRKDKQL